MTQPRIEVEGAREVARRLRKVEGGMADLKKVHADAAEIVEVRAAAIVPRRTGALKSTVRSTGQARGGVVRAGFKRVLYAGVIHFGWPKHNISPQPFLYDALDQRATEVVDVYETRVNKLIKQNGLDKR